jgi:hypothetical protein
MSVVLSARTKWSGLGFIRDISIATMSLKQKGRDFRVLNLLTSVVDTEDYWVREI